MQVGKVYLSQAVVQHALVQATGGGSAHFVSIKFTSVSFLIGHSLLLAANSFVV